MFRSLRADEVEVRVGQFKEGSFAALLLYKDARCDMNILDEGVGAMNWKREHSRDNANCIVSIWDEGKKQWISKEDTGTESNTEKEKGLASDSFKRACVNWGIGRELYTGPQIKFFLKNFPEVDKFTKYEVTHLTVLDGKITELKIEAILNFGKDRKQVFAWKSEVKVPERKPFNREGCIKAILEFNKDDELETILNAMGAKGLNSLNEIQLKEVYKRLKG